jgi:two-component system cell cycle sensor histidine kinase/response regulator CckA
VQLTEKSGAGLGWSTPIRVLPLEDSALDAELVRGVMERGGLRCEITAIPDKPGFEMALALHEYELILCDHDIPGYDGFSALRLAREVQPLTPVIMLSGALDDEQAVESLKGGATDYILKQRLARLVPAICRALNEGKERAEKKELEAAYLRTQRMNSIGSLAGGIAHDLNNALAPVLMSAELLTDCRDKEQQDRFLEIIASCSLRAIGMVKQIVGFLRGYGGVRPVLMSQVIGEMGKLVQETFPKSIAITLNAGGSGLWQVQGDVTELHQVLLNLCVNARDAMPNGGRLALSAQNIMLGEKDAETLKLGAGPYVMLSVADTGNGIPSDVLPKIFEAFFTTKMSDKGTGLGLSTVASIVKHHGGAISVTTEVGVGTEFRVHIPAIDATSEEAVTKSDEVALPTGHGELILVIDDEEVVRELTKTTLENYGYRVVTAQNGLQGIARFEEHKNEVRVVVTDSDMPHLDGMAAIRAIKEIKPDMPVIFASASKCDTEQMRKTDLRQMTNLGKPFSLEQLLIAVGTAIVR